MRQSLAILAVAATTLGCDNRLAVQCEINTNCNLTSGGVCTKAPNGNLWCAYGDPNCPSGLRYDTQDVGDGLAGSVAGAEPDAGVPVDAGPPPPPGVSCLGMPNNCGNNGDDSCCNSLLVPGGSYFRSYDLAGDSISGDTSYPATVSSFRLDKYEVTVGRFRAFVELARERKRIIPRQGLGRIPIFRTVAGSRAGTRACKGTRTC